MHTFIIKPVFWNTANYKKPSGVHATSGYPRDTGYGHEEWNNSDGMKFEIDSVSYRAFHTEEIGNLRPSADDALVMMYASHSGRQDLVGVCGSATCLIDNQLERERLYTSMNLSVLSADAWNLDIVRERYANNKAEFRRVWDRDVSWIPNWICPEEMFFWLDKPVRLDAQMITGKTKLISRFSGYHSVSAEQALVVLKTVPKQKRNLTWQRIVASIEAGQSRDTLHDVQDIEKDRRVPVSTRKALIDARLGQGRFRKDLEARWGSACAVTGCTVRDVLRASHIKAWRHSTNDERLDGSNGLLLSANIDSLFDRGLLSFTDAGGMLLANRISKPDRDRLGLYGELRKTLTPLERNYLSHHRNTYGF